MEQHPFLNNWASEFVKSSARLAPFHAPAFHLGTKPFLLALKAMFFHRRTESSGMFVYFLYIATSHTRTKRILIMQMSFSCIHLLKYGQRDKKRAWKALFEGRQSRMIRNVQKCASGSDPEQSKTRWNYFSSNSSRYLKVEEKVCESCGRRGRHHLSFRLEVQGGLRNFLQNIWLKFL